jgi:cellulose 1,4-beta-cellobiosidase
LNSHARRSVGWLTTAGGALVITAAVVIATVFASAVALAGTGHSWHRSVVLKSLICQPDGRRTITFHGVPYIVRNDVFYPERECIKLARRSPGFTVVASHANSHVDNNEAFPEVIYGCEWGVCSPHTELPRKVYRFRVLTTSWSTSWRRAPGRFDVGYDIWFGHLHTIHGHALGAELMIWLGTKRFGVPIGDPVVRLDGQSWYYARHLACDGYGCWNYVLFRRVIPTTHVTGLSLLPFIHYAEQRRQIGYREFLKSVDAGFEIWQQGRGLAVHSYSVRVRLHTVRGSVRHHHHAG